MHGALVWQEFDKAVTLTTIVRQDETQTQFRNTLMSLREYKLTEKQAVWLQQFQWERLRRSYGQELLTRMSSEGLFVFPNHSGEWNHNKLKILELNRSFPIAKISAVTTGFHSKSSSSDKAGGLVRTLFLCKGAKVMLTTNLNVPFGLFNGSMGTVVDILYLDGKKTKDSLPNVVMVEFQKYSGPPFLLSHPKLVPIVPVERKLDCNCYQCKRKQIPLRLGWGTTIHRCQGMTIGEGESNRFIVINPGTRHFESKTPGALFVALSRAKSAGGDNNLPDFAWHPHVLVNQDRLCHVVSTATTKARKHEMNRIAAMSKKTKESFGYLYQDDAFLTLQSKLNQIVERHEE